MRFKDNFPLAPKKWPLILLGLGAIFILINTPYFYYKNKKTSLSYQFQGRVDSVWYDDKGGPTIKVNGNKYDLLVNYWDFNHQIEVGDSLIKVKNSMLVRIIKKNGKVIIVK